MDLPHALHRATPAEMKARLEAERREPPFLLFRDGEGAQQIHDLGSAAERLTIGRSASNDSRWPGTARCRACTRASSTSATSGRSSTTAARTTAPTSTASGCTAGAGCATAMRSPSAARCIVFRSPSGRESLRTATSQRAAPPKVSEAQLRVLTALCQPYIDSSFAVPASNRQIADELIIGVETVKTHMRALFDAFELGALPQHQKRAALAQRAMETGLVSSSELK